MSETTNSITVTLGYKNTDATRNYKFSGVEASALSSVKTKIQEFNSNIVEQDRNIFISDDYDPNNDVGTLTKIVAAKYVTVTETPIE